MSAKDVTGCMKRTAHWFRECARAISEHLMSSSRTARPASLEDIVQSALIKAVRHLASYRGEAALFTWLTEICRNELSDEHRRANRRPAHISLDEPEAAHRWEEILRAPDAQEPVSQLQAATERAE